MKSYPAFAIAQYVAGSVALKTVPPVTFCPAIIFSFTGFQIFVPGGALNAGPYFQSFGSSAPWFCAPGGGVVFALLFCPAGAASGQELGCCPCARNVAAPRVIAMRTPRPTRVISRSFSRARLSHYSWGPANPAPTYPHARTGLRA